LCVSVPDTTAELAIHVLQRNAAAFLEEAPAARSGDDPRHVHHTRVATRRLRGALRLFGDVLPPESSSLDAELEWIAGQLGQVRDVDVQIDRLRQRAAELGLSEALVPYGAWLEGQRQRAQIALQEALGSARCQELVQRLEQLNSLQPDATTDTPLTTDAPRRLRRVFKKLTKRGDRINKSSPNGELHKVRIRAKRVRYAAEFFEVAYGKPARRLVKRAVALQDLLGDLQDGVVGNQHIHQAVQTAAGTWPANTSLALGRIVQFEAQHALEIRRRFADVYDGVKDKGSRLLDAPLLMS
jgi:CHAD domain-containing protein